MNQPDEIHSFAADFEPSSDEQWRGLVDKVLKGAAFERLISSTADDIDIPPLTHRNSDPARPYRQAQSCLAATRIDLPDSSDANSCALKNIAGGAEALHLVFAGAAGDYGFGLDTNSTTALAAALREIDSATTALILDAPASDTSLAAAAAELIENGGLNPAQAKISFGLNPLEMLLRHSVSDSDVADAAQSARRVASSLLRRGFTGPLFCADARTIHAAGASEAQELAYLLASAIYYLRLLEDGHIDLTNAVQLIGFRVAADTDQLLTIAKMRALRRLFARVADVCGLPAQPIHIHAETAWRMMTRYDPWMNVLRATMATFSAIVGGADAVSVIPHSQVLGLPNEEARRLARNIHLILREEAHVDVVIDPAGGSGGLEHLTNELCDKAWGLFQEFEGAGGLIHCIRNGSLADSISGVQEKRQMQIARCALPITGTSTFPNLDEHAPEVLAIAPDNIGDRYSASFRPLRVANAFEQLRDRVEHYEGENQRPGIFLANFGPLAAYNARSNFAQNFVAAAGFDVTPGECLESAEHAAKAFSASGCFCSCICSSDELLAEHAQEWLTALKTTGQGPVILAQKPLRQSGENTGAMADWHIYDGCDRIQALRNFVTAFENHAGI